MRRPPRHKPDLREPLALGASLVLYSNGLAVYAQRRGDFPEAFFRRLNPVFIGLMLAYAALRPGGLASVGLRREGLLKSLAAGLGVGLALSVPPLIFFYRPFLLDTPLEYGPISKLTREELILDVFVSVPIGIAVLEELGHRGLLYSALRRELSPKAAIIGSSLAFAGWHFAVTATSAAQTNISTAARLPRPLRPYVQLLAVLGGMLTTGLAGGAFALLRERTGNLAGPIVAHWVVDGIMISALWRRRPSGQP